MAEQIVQKPFVVAIAGPTATGKTAAAVSVAKALGGEVLSMDSMQIYRGLSIGTAAPTAEEMQGVPHHLLGFRPPETPYSVAEYQRDARQAMADVLARGRLPVFTGGTGLYLQAVSHPLRFTESGGDSAVRQRLQQEAEAPEGPQKLLMRLAVVDPESAQRLHQNNTRRIIRALEVFEQTGRAMSESNTDWREQPDEHWLIFALTMPRDALRKRIAARVDAMLSRGLIDEVRALLSGGVPRDAQALQAIGYKEIIAMLDGQLTEKEAVEAIRTHTAQYAKRQMTWLRGDPRVRWLDVTDYPDTETLHTALAQWIRNEMERIHAEHR